MILYSLCLSVSDISLSVIFAKPITGFTLLLLVLPTGCSMTSKDEGGVGEEGRNGLPPLCVGPAHVFFLSDNSVENPS